jgi:integrase
MDCGATAQCLLSRVPSRKVHRKRQAAERLLMGAGWTDLDLVFCHIDGTMLNPERFTRGFSDAVRRLGLPPIRLHDLRHGWATLALQAGIHPDGGSGAARAREHRYHDGCLQPRDRWVA